MHYMEVAGVRELTESELITVSGGGGVANAVVAAAARFPVTPDICPLRPISFCGVGLRLAPQLFLVH
jgi:hypothetical protein